MILHCFTVTDPRGETARELAPTASVAIDQRRAALLAYATLRRAEAMRLSPRQRHWINVQAAETERAADVRELEAWHADGCSCTATPALSTADLYEEVMA